MIVDISFIPENLIPLSLKEVANTRMEYPYIHNELFTDDLLIKDATKSKCAAFVQNRNQYRQNYWEFEEKLFEFSKDQMNQKNYDLASKCLNYLLEIGSKLPEVKEELLKVYKKHKDENNLLKMKIIIQNEIEMEVGKNSVKEENIKLLNKYFS